MESISRPLYRNQASSATLSKKLLNANGYFSSKNAYDDVFAGPPKFGAQASSPSVEDYVEIFGGSKASRASSIPIVDLSALEETNVSVHARRSKLDYSKIFGGFRDEEIASSYEEVFAKPKKGENFSKKARTPAETVSPCKGSDHLNYSEESQLFSHQASHESFDGGKQFNMSFHKSNQKRNNETNGTTHIAQLHAVPGFTYFVDEKTPLQKTECDKSVPSLKGDVNFDMDFRKGLREGKHHGKAVPNLTTPHNSDSGVKFDSNCSPDKFHSNDKSFYGYEINLKTQPSNFPPPSSLPTKVGGGKGDFKRSTTSNSKVFKSDASKGGPGDSSPPFSDEEIDVNSAAAAPAAALRKAIEKAQASIRIAKESMERKKEGFRSFPKPSSKNGLDAKDRRDKKVAGETNRTKKKNANGIRERVDAASQVFAGIERQTAMRSGKVAPESKDSENLFIARNIVVEADGNKAELTKECEATRPFPEVVSTSQHRTATIVFKQADSKNIMQSVDAHEGASKEMKTAEGIFQQQEGNGVRVVEEAHKLDNMERTLNAFRIAEDLEEHVIKMESAQEVHGQDENEETRAAHDDETKDTQQNSCEQGKCEKILKETHEPIEIEFFECQEWNESENEKRPNDAQEWMQNEKKQQEVLKQEENEKIIKDANEKEENETRLPKIREQENEKRLKEAWECVDYENKLRESCEGESNEKRHNDAHKGEDNEKWLDTINDLEIIKKRLSDNYDGGESEKRLKEDSKWEGNEKQLTEAHEYDKKLVEAHEYEETESIQRETDQCRDNGKTKMNQEAVEEEKSLDAASDECKRDASESMSGTQEPHINNENDNNMDINPEVTAYEKCERKLHFYESFCELKENEKEQGTVEVEYELDEKVICKAAGLAKSAAEHIEIENRMNHTTKAFLFDDNQTDTDLIKTNFGQEQIDQNEKESEVASDSGNRIERLEHESGENDEKVEAEIAFDHGKDGDFETAHEESLVVDLGNKLDAPQPQSGEDEEAEIAFDQGKDDDFETAHEESLVVDLGNKLDAPQPQSGEDEEAEIAFDQGKDNNFETAHEESQEVEVGEAEITLVKERDNNNFETAHEEKEEVETGNKLEASQPSKLYNLEGKEKIVKIDEEIKLNQNTRKNEANLSGSFATEDEETKETVQIEVKVEKEHLLKTDEANKREKEREKDRIAVERAIREVRERAFAEARERAERAAVERATAEARQRVMAETREKFEKASAGNKSSSEKASVEAKLRAERAAVERATAEARERALEKLLSQKATSVAREQAERIIDERFSGASRDNGMTERSSSFDTQRSSHNETNGESSERHRASLERHQRTMERAAKALAEKNKRDLRAQKEQAERNRLAEVLDADVKRWSNGKEGNLRALLSTLQYILGPDSGWQPISLTEIVTTNAVKKAYRKATLYVHPDKLQQRGANIQQKYICEKVFDLLKAAWNRFNSEER
ncbi:auxilin-like protein 1 [Cornus florida]|uniref:auxilin-like protein 1 n=1 Tax=Cornus florida TaxID=4283 RepID=UPI00289AF5E0|nr:auxilin-like protein 1 [Cornus florida]